MCCEFSIDVKYVLLRTHDLTVIYHGIQDIN